MPALPETRNPRRGHNDLSELVLPGSGLLPEPGEDCAKKQRQGSHCLGEISRADRKEPNFRERLLAFYDDLERWRAGNRETEPKAWESGRDRL